MAEELTLNDIVGGWLLYRRNNGYFTESSQRLADAVIAEHDRALSEKVFAEGSSAGLSVGLDIAELVVEGQGTLNLRKIPPPPVNPYTKKEDNADS